MKINFLRDQTDLIMKLLVNNGLVYTGETGITIPNELLEHLSTKFTNLELYLDSCNIASLEAYKISKMIISLTSIKSEYDISNAEINYNAFKSKLISKLNVFTSRLIKYPEVDEYREEAIALLNNLNPEIRLKILKSLDIIFNSSKKAYLENQREVTSINLSENTLQHGTLNLLEVDINKNIETVLVENQKKFYEMLTGIHIKSGMKQCEVSRRSGIHETTLSKILSGKKTNITRDMLIRLALTYNLSLTETNELLKQKGYFLCGDNMRNLIIMIGIENGMSLDFIDQELFDRELPTLMQVS